MTCRFLVFAETLLFVKKKCRGVAMVHSTLFFLITAEPPRLKGHLFTTATVFGGQSIH